MTTEELYKVIFEMDSLDELRKLNRVICDRISAVRSLKGSVVKALCQVGDMVEFDSRKYGLTKQGMLMKKNRTRAEVTVDGQRWTVPFSMLRKVDDGL